MTVLVTAAAERRVEHAPRLSPDAALVIKDDGEGLILDMNGDFFGISGVGAEMLRAAFADGEAAAARQVAARYGAPERQVATDLAALLADLRAQGVLEGGARPRRLARIGGRALAGLATLLFRASRARGLRAGAALLLARLSFAAFGWRASVDAWRAAFPEASTPRVDDAAAAAIDQVVRNAAARDLTGVDCKERGLACFALARAEGLAATLRIGVNLYPLGGHCWCLIGDRIVSDAEERVAPFLPVFAYR